MKKFTAVLFILAISFFIVDSALAGQQGKVVKEVPSVQRKPSIKSQESSQHNPRAVIDPHDRPGAGDQGSQRRDLNTAPSVRRNQARETVQNRTPEESDIEMMELQRLENSRKQAIQRTSQTTESIHESAMEIIENIK